MVRAQITPNTHNIHQFLVVGRSLVTEKNPNPVIYKMRIFAKDSIRAKSKFWYFLHKMRKVKKATGEILSVNEVRSLNKKDL